MSNFFWLRTADDVRTYFELSTSEMLNLGSVFAALNTKNHAGVSTLFR